MEEAIEIANGTRYGLGASVFGPEQESCIKVAKQLECGMVSVNDFGVFYVSPIFSLYTRCEMLNCLEGQSRFTFRWYESQRLWKIWCDTSIILTFLSVSFVLVGGPEGLRSLTNPKAIIFDRWPSIIQTSIPQVLDYPIRSLHYSW